MSTKYQPGQRISEYLLEECVGSGSFCEVWRARHHVWSDDRVAVKLPIEPEYVRYLRREGLVVHGLRHPNIARVIGIDPYAELPYLIIELVNGPSLKAVLEQHPKGLPISPAVLILRGILNALVAAHAANVLHRDIKPGNVLLHTDGKGLDGLMIDQVKVADFGLGMGGTDTLRSIAQSGSIDRDDKLVGTLAYMAPELREGRGTAEPKTDLYSVGVVLFELLTGERPAGAELPSAMRAEVMPALDEVFRRLYARHDRRYESAEAALADLDARLGLRRATTARDGGGPPPIPAMVKCASCRRAVDAADQFCVHCGAQTRENVRRCSQCSGYPGPNDRYCIFCGARLPALFAV